MSVVAQTPSGKVLVALDGSEAAATALPTARAVGAQLGAVVEVVHIVSEEAPESVVRSRLQLDSESGLTVRVEMGDPSDVILRCALDPQVVVLVLATHGSTVHRQRNLAGTARAVTGRVARPILLVRPEGVYPCQEAAPLRHLLFPFDGTPTTTRALQPAMDLVCRLGASIDLLYVVHPHQTRPEERGTISPPMYMDHPHYDWPAWENSVAEWLRWHCDNIPSEAPVRVFVVRGVGREEIGSAIARFAAEREEDAIVLVRRSNLEAGRAPVLRAVLELAPCPVLIVPGPPRGTASAGPQSRVPSVMGANQNPGWASAAP